MTCWAFLAVLCFAGVSLACAIALHNIPEGVAVALPVYFATGSRWRGLQTAVLSGLAEPLAVVLLGLVLPFMQLNKHVVDGMLAGVGGIMAFLAFHELLPLSMQHAGKPLAVGCLFGGMGLMSVTLHYLNTHVLADLH
jgi:ZIP family zinc transporter